MPWPILGFGMIYTRDPLGPHFVPTTVPQTGTVRMLGGVPTLLPVPTAHAVFPMVVDLGGPLAVKT